VPTRAGADEDAVDGVRPRAVCEPDTPAQTAAMLAEAGRDSLAVVPRGGGTKLGWGRPPAAVDLILSTRRLTARIDHRDGDLTAVVPAGATLADVNGELGRRGQWIPLDPFRADRATIGGIVATNDSGPRRQRYGAPRDLIIGVEIARVDGKLAKAGGQVVKNVAGYDITKLMAGSFGGLAIVTSATFKLVPLPAASSTTIVEVRSRDRLEPLLAALSASALEPSAVEVHLPPLRVLVRFESTPTSVARQAEAVAMQARTLALESDIVAGDRERADWEAHTRRPWEGQGTVARLSVLPGDLAGVLQWLDDVAASEQVEHEVAGRAGLGVVLVRVGGSPESQARIVERLRQRLMPGRGSVAILRAEIDVKRRIDVWGPVGDALGLMKAVKARFDPTDILNRGRTAY
jgi:glycolate oxidase FAD binding subunit